MAERRVSRSAPRNNCGWSIAAFECRRPSRDNAGERGCEPRRPSRDDVATAIPCLGNSRHPIPEPRQLASHGVHRRSA
jgi:hypothetical protein